MRVTSITPMKNEAPYILEWVAHNRAVGINDMLVFTNDCTDGTDQMLERLDEMGLVRHMPNPSSSMGKPRHHIALIRYVNDMVRLRRSDWVTNLDADEFVRVKTGNGTIEDLANALPEAHAITLSLHTFGCSGIEDIAPGGGLVSETFTRRGRSETHRAPVKYLARGDFPWTAFRNNAPVLDEARLGEVTWVNGDGTALPEEVIREPFKGLHARFSGYGMVDVAHYTIRSFHGFLLQRDRGSANPQKDEDAAQLDVEEAMKYWTRFDRNAVQDDLAARPKPALRAAVDELLKDPELRALHDAALEWHRNRAQELLQQPAYRDLMRRMREQHAASTADAA